MWIVRLALRRPYTFVVMALLIAILGTLSIATMPVDIFPYIDLPVVSIVWQYTYWTGSNCPYMPYNDCAQKLSQQDIAGFITNTGVQFGLGLFLGGPGGGTGSSSFPTCSSPTGR